MEIWQGILLGAIQGFTEFLPVSSSGHLMLLQKWFGIEHAMFYSVMLHIGTLIPVIIVLWKELLSLFKKPFSKFGCLVLASIPAGIIGLIAGLLIDLDAIFINNIWLLGITFLITAGLMLFAEIRSKKVEMLSPINAKTSLVMGVGQMVGVFSGISRSGATIAASAIVKVEREKAASFTFLMSVPVIVAAAGLESVKMISEGSIGDVQVLPLILGVITAMITGYIAIKVMLNLIKKANYKWFSVYLVGISIATFITAFV